MAGGAPAEETKASPVVVEKASAPNAIQEDTSPEDQHPPDHQIPAGRKERERKRRADCVLDGPDTGFGGGCVVRSGASRDAVQSVLTRTDTNSLSTIPHSHDAHIQLEERHTFFVCTTYPTLGGVRERPSRYPGRKMNRRSGCRPARWSVVLLYGVWSME